MSRKILESFEFAKADYIVTGNRGLLAPMEFHFNQSFLRENSGRLPAAQEMIFSIEY